MKGKHSQDTVTYATKQAENMTDSLKTAPDKDTAALSPLMEPSPQEIGSITKNKAITSMCFHMEIFAKVTG
jgi:hypothetical protein